MKYSEWLENVPCEITNDPIWKLEVYRLALFAADIGWKDMEVLSRKPLMRGAADQQYRAGGSSPHRPPPPACGHLPQMRRLGLVDGGFVDAYPKRSEGRAGGGNSAREKLFSVVLSDEVPLL